MNARSFARSSESERIEGSNARLFARASESERIEGSNARLFAREQSSVQNLPEKARKRAFEKWLFRLAFIWLLCC